MHDALPKQTFQRIVSQIRMNPTTVQSVVTCDTIIEFANPELKLFPGMTAYVTIPVATAVKYDYPFAAYKSESRITEHLLHYSRSYELKDVRIPVERLEDLKKCSRQISDDERAYTIMKMPQSFDMR